MTDLGTQSGLAAEHGDVPALHRAVHPNAGGRWCIAHGVKFMFHSCGAVREAIPELIELGVDILNPIQPAAAGMEPEGLKRDFGEQLCFHGGVDIQYLLPLEIGRCGPAGGPAASRDSGARRRIHPGAIAQSAAGHKHGEHPGDV